MVSLLLIISFILHAVTLLAVYQLFQQLEKTKQDKNDELETMLLDFMQEIKAENEQLIEISKQKMTSATTTNASFINEKKVNQPTSEPFQQTEQENDAFDISSLVEQYDEVTELSEEGKVLQLQEKGFSTEDIARKLNRGKTEIELILKLQQQIKQNT